MRKVVLLNMKVKTYIFTNGGNSMFKTVAKAREISCLSDKLTKMFMNSDRLKNSPEECDLINQLILRISELLDSVCDDFEKLLDEITEGQE